MTYTVPASGTYTFTAIVPSGAIVSVYKYKLIERIVTKPRWWEFWKREVVTERYVFDGEVLP